MSWRKSSFVVLLILVNYVIFSILGSYVFVASADTTPTHTPLPTFTPGSSALTRVSPLPYFFLTPGASQGSGTGTPARSSLPAALPTVAPSATRSQ
jgi:hypothetical protein